MSGGTEGGMAPHWLVLERGEGDGDAAAGPALAIGAGAYAADIPPEQIGRSAQVDMVAAGVRERDARRADREPGRCPFRAGEVSAADAGARRRRPGARRRRRDQRHAQVDGTVRAASALGIAVALGEIDRGAIAEEAIGTD